MFGFVLFCFGLFGFCCSTYVGVHFSFRKITHLNKYIYVFCTLEYSRWSNFHTHTHIHTRAKLLCEACCIQCKVYCFESLYCINSTIGFGFTWIDSVKIQSNPEKKYVINKFACIVFRKHRSSLPNKMKRMKIFVNWFFCIIFENLSFLSKMYGASARNETPFSALESDRCRSTAATPIAIVGVWDERAHEWFLALSRRTAT